jgi:hypothetical protein
MVQPCGEGVYHCLPDSWWGIVDSLGKPTPAPRGEVSNRLSPGRKRLAGVNAKGPRSSWSRPPREGEAQGPSHPRPGKRGANPLSRQINALTGFRRAFSNRQRCPRQTRGNLTVAPTHFPRQGSCPSWFGCAGAESQGGRGGNRGGLPTGGFAGPTAHGEGNE